MQVKQDHGALEADVYSTSPQYRSVFSDTFMLRINADGCAITFAQKDVNESGQNEISREVKVFMSLATMKLLSRALDGGVKNYEAEHGPISVKPDTLKKLEDLIARGGNKPD